MKPIEIKLILFLASPDLSDADFERLSQLLQSRELSRCISAASYLRKEARPAVEHIKRIQRDVTNDFREPELNPQFVKDVSSIIRSLKLTPAEGLRRLHLELGIEAESHPSRSLRSGIVRLLRVADMNQIWAAAQRMKSKATGKAEQHAWPLGQTPRLDGNL
ncbi:MAG TPA: hypothetical protein VEX43_06030 [Chthoniobacterales bacterium]|nr:hypothetical protein [Chthoniobacterales bacterium]